MRIMKQKITTNLQNYWTKKLHPRFAGLVGGLIFFCLSLVPSLLPRTSFFQGIIAGITFAIGYGFGTAAGNLYQLFHKSRKTKTAKSLLNKYIYSALILLCVIFLIAGRNWQNDIRVVTNAPKEGAFQPFVIAIIAFFVAYLLIGLSRKILRMSRRISNWLEKKLSKKTATYLGGIATAILLILFVDGVVFRTAMAVSNTLFGYQNNGTPEGIVRIDIPEVSGSSGSSIGWETLGEKGREFIGKTSKAEDIEKTLGINAKQPIRIYSGIKSASTQDEQIAQIISELERTNAHQRSVILVANSTGSGGINPVAVGAVEYINHGDTATVGMQYSYLPSWISFLADKEKARQAGEALFNATYGWWLELEPSNRPKLVVYGESLGSYGAEGAFSGEYDIYNRTDGAVFVGPPNSNEIWSEFVTDRDQSTPMWQPTYKQGEFVRFADYPEDLQKPTADWGDKRVVYFQHASDPVVWWSPELILNKPDWLREPRGNDVIEQTRWYPFVSFWQVTIDLALAYGVPDGHGHKYGTKSIDGWINVLQPANWTTKDSEAVKKALY